MEQIGFQLSNANPEINLISYQDNYFCTDNLRQINDPKMPNCIAVKNDQYHIIITVLQGSMNLKVNGIEVKLKSNDYLVIMPFTTIEILSARCKYFYSAIKGYIALDMYDHMGIKMGVKRGCYTFHHYHFRTQQIAILQKDYLNFKQDLQKDIRVMKESVIKARIGVYISDSFSFMHYNPEIPHYSESPIAKLFITFLTMLDDEYIKERSVQYYANKLGVLPKLVSTITLKFTGKTASRVIDDYVIYRITVELYNNRLNIKEVSEIFNFPTQSFFGRYFKRITGYSPRKYMSMYSKKLSRQ